MHTFSHLTTLFVFLCMILMFVGGIADAQGFPSLEIAGDTTRVYAIGDTVEAVLVASIDGQPASGVQLTIESSGISDVVVSNDGITDVSGRVTVTGTIEGEYAYISAEWEREATHNSARAEFRVRAPLPEGAIARLGEGEIEDYVNEVNYSPDGRRLAVSSWEDIWIYDAHTGEALNVLWGHSGDVYSVSFSRDGQVLASASDDATVRLWDVQTGELLHTLRGHPNGVWRVSFSPDGQVLASVGSGIEDATVRLWDARTGTLLHTLRGHTDWVRSVSFSPDGQVLASATNDETFRLWDARTGVLLHTLTGHTRRISSVSFSPDGQVLASGGEDETVRLWDVQTGTLLRTLRGYSASFSPDGQVLASVSYDKTVRLWDVQTGELLHTLREHWGTVFSVSFSPDGQVLASGGEDETVRLWDVQTGTLLHTFTGHTGPVQSVSFSPDGQTLVSVGFDRFFDRRPNTVFLWDATPFLTSPLQLPEDVNKDGIVDIIDLALIASNFGKPAPNVADINGDGIVDVIDLALVAAAFGNTAAAPEIGHLHPENMPTSAAIETWLRQARQMNLTDPAFQRGILILEQLLAALTPKETALLPNYPNPFNPETWIPYQLSEASDVTVSIYAVNGHLIRTLVLGHQSAGVYQSKNRAAYWDGRNAFGERVSSGLYFYTLTAGEFTATRKMLIRK